MVAQLSDSLDGAGEHKARDARLDGSGQQRAGSLDVDPTKRRIIVTPAAGMVNLGGEVDDRIDPYEGGSEPVDVRKVGDQARTGAGRQGVPLTSQESTYLGAAFHEGIAHMPA
jgi:hypothetical protein